MILPMRRNILSKKIQLKSYFFRDEDIPKYTLYTLGLPNEIKEIVNKYLKNEKGYVDGIKSKDIGNALMMLFPEIVFVNTAIFNKQQEDWIFSTDKIDVTFVKRIVKDWVNKALENNKVDAKVALKEDWQWSDGFSSTEVIIRKSSISDSGFIFNIIPAIFAYDFCKKPLFFSTINENVKFNLFCDSTKRECVSQCFGRYNKFSFVVNFVLAKNRDYPGKYFIQTNVSIRSWAKKKCFNEDGGVILKGGNSRSIYISFENPYRDNNEDIFVKVKLDRKGKEFQINAEPRFCEKYINDKYRGFKEVISDALEKPEKYILGHNGKRVWIQISIKDTNMAPANPGPGLPIRKEIHYIMQEKYGVIARNEIENIDVKDAVFKNEFFFNADLKRVILEIYPSESELTSLVKQVLTNKLEFIDKGDNIYELDKFQIELQEKGSLNNLLNVNEYDEDRCGILAKKLDKYSKSTVVVALIQLSSYHEHKDNEIAKRDPKNAIRLAMMKINRTNQFINELNKAESEDKKDSEASKKGKVLNSLLDLFSDLGVQRNDYKDKEFDKKILMGITKLNNSVALSYIVDGKPFCRFYGNEWKTLSKSLLSVSQDLLKKSVIKKQIRKKASNQFIVENINELLAKYNDRELIVCFDAALRNGYWEFAQNDKMNVTELSIKAVDRVKFLRFNALEEVPDYFILNGKNKFQQGFEKVCNILLNDNLSFHVEIEKDKNKMKVLDADIEFNIQRLLDIDEYLEDTLARYGVEKLPMIIVRILKIDNREYLTIFVQAEEKVSMYINDVKVINSLNLKKGSTLDEKFYNEKEISGLSTEKINEYINKIINLNRKNTDIYFLVENSLIHKVNCDSYKKFNDFSFLENCFDGYLIEGAGIKKAIIHSKYIDVKDKGLFSENCSTFYSVGARPDTIRESSEKTKLTDPNKTLNKQRLVEIIVAGSSSDMEGKSLGQLAHVLRGLNITFGFHTKMPLPIFLIKKHKKYIDMIKS